MPRNKRLHFKDLNATRAFLALPVFFFFFFTYTQNDDLSFLALLKNYFQSVSRASLDLFFLISSFLITSHGLREYKYVKRFSYRSFVIRRMLRLAAPLVLTLLFLFIVHPWLIRVLDLQAVQAFPKAGPFILLFPNYVYDHFPIDLAYVWPILSIYMFIQFYLIWGLMLRYLNAQLTIICVIAIIVGLTNRILHLALDTDYIFDTLAYGIPVGIGGYLAITIRKENQLFQRLKEMPKNINKILYAILILLYLVSYFLLANSYASVLIPIVLSILLGYVILDQTFGKNSPFLLKKFNLLTSLGRLSYGFIVYQGIIALLMMVAISTLDYSSASYSVLALIFAVTFIASVVMASITYRLMEKPLIRIRRAFKKV